MDSVIGSQDLGGVLLVKDCLEAPGVFLLLQALKQALSCGFRVIYLSLSQGPQQLQQLLRKLGLSLPALVTSGQLVLLDLLQALSPLGKPCGTLTVAADPVLWLEGVFAQAAALQAGGGSSSSSSSSSQPTLLVLDDLSLLAAEIGDAQQLEPFLHHCCHLGEMLQLQGGYCFAALTHSDVEDDAPFVSRLEHAAQTVLELEPLESGQSSEVTGQLMVWRRRSTDRALRPAGTCEDAGVEGITGWGMGCRAFYYKLTDSGAAYFPQGR